MKKNNIVGIVFGICIISLLVLLFQYRNNPQSSLTRIFGTSKCMDCNVLIVAFDALQANHTSYLRYARETTPTIDSIAKDGVSFDTTISSASWTVPSYMSIFTGLNPSEHKVINKFVKFTPEEKVITNLSKVSPNVKTLAQVFKDNGYKTAGFTGDAGVSAQFGYAQGFDVFKDNSAFGTVAVAATQAAQWLKENKDQKFFLFLHGYDMHGQFKLPEGYKGKFMPENYAGPYTGTPQEQRDLREKGIAGEDLGLTEEDVAYWKSWYDSKIYDADARFAKFWKEFDAMGLRKNTIVVLLSDHGTEVYEHKRFDHGHTLYDELVHVLLVFSGPGIPKGVRINPQVSTLDIAPTILDTVGITPDKTYASQIRGRSLKSSFEGKEITPQDIYMETDYRDYTHKRAIRTADGWKYILTMETGKSELYNIMKDPDETFNLADTDLKRAYDLEYKVRKHLEDMGVNPYGPWTTGCLPVYGDQCLP